MLLIALKSTHMRHVPSFLGTKIIGTTQGLRETRMYPLSSNACTCFCISFVSLGLVMYGARLGNVALGISQFGVQYHAMEANLQEHLLKTHPQNPSKHKRH